MYIRLVHWLHWILHSGTSCDCAHPLICYAGGRGGGRYGGRTREIVVSELEDGWPMYVCETLLVRRALVVRGGAI